MSEDAQLVADRLRKHCTLRPTLGLVLGSGFAEASFGLRKAVEVPYAKLPGFPVPSVAGHEGHLTLGYVGATQILALFGRAHFYEGYAMDLITFPIRVAAAFGVRNLLLTNAAGAINKSYRPADFMAFTDHINLMGTSPLRGELQAGCERFVDLSRVYDDRLTDMLKASAKKAKCRLHAGVYLAVCGPNYETPAEIRAFGRWGADAVGMSTVPEAIVARQCGLRVAALSCITNLAAGRGKEKLSHAEVLAVGRKTKHAAGELIHEFCELYAQKGED